jgi:AraC-like DNA-binding protein
MIPTYRTADRLPHGIGLRRVVETEPAHRIAYAHRDDFYIFAFIEKGRGRVSIDFEECAIDGSMIRCILPGQVHFPLECSELRGWLLALDPALVREEYGNIFTQGTFTGGTRISDREAADLLHCISSIRIRLESPSPPPGQSILLSLVDLYVGMMAEIYGKVLSAVTDRRAIDITLRFKRLLSASYKTMKTPSQYAAQLNLSPAYLNEAVKRTTGLTAGDCIRNEIILQAKRLLIYSKASIKEIAAQLGYDDPAYFSRLFAKTASFSPTRFREKFLE